MRWACTRPTATWPTCSPSRAGPVSTAPSARTPSWSRSTSTGGPRVDGTDPHHEWGSTNEYPTEGSLAEYHLPPFEAAIDAGTSSIMPYYAKPVNEPSAQQLPEDLWYSETQQFEEVAFAYNEHMLQDILRDELGFEGYVNSDTGIIKDRIWGVEDLTLPERYDDAMAAGTNLFSGDGDTAPLREAVELGLVTEGELDESLSFTLAEMFDLGLFEDPYVDPERAQRIGDSAESQAKADAAHQKSVVLLKNSEQDGEAALPITDEEIGDVRLYVEVFTGEAEESAEQTEGLQETFRQLDESIEIVDDPAAATHSYLWVIPSLNWREDDTAGDPPSVLLRKDQDTGIDHERIVALQDQIETNILSVNFTNPWLVNEIEPGADAVLSTFNTTPEAVVDVIRGEYDPTGQMPFTVPASQEAVEQNASDVPGYAEDFDYAYVDSDGNEWDLRHGLDYQD